MTLVQAKEMNTEAMTRKQELHTAYTTFWTTRPPPPRTRQWILRDFTRLFPQMVNFPSLLIRDIRTHQNNGTLHNWMVTTQPITFQRWEEVRDTITTLDEAFQNLRAYVPDPSIELGKRTQAVKDNVGSLQGDILALDNPQARLTVNALEITSKDVDTLYAEIRKLEALGVVWDEATFGISRTLMREWRLKLAQHLDEANVIKKRRQKEQDSISEQYSLAAKDIPWPKISWLERWIRSSKEMDSKTTKINIIKRCL